MLVRAAVTLTIAGSIGQPAVVFSASYGDGEAEWYGDRGGSGWGCGSGYGEPDGGGRGDDLHRRWRGT